MKIVVVFIVFFSLTIAKGNAKDLSTNTSSAFVDRVFTDCASKNYDDLDSFIHSAFLVEDPTLQILNLRTIVVVIGMLQLQSDSGADSRSLRLAVGIATWATEKLMRKAVDDKVFANEFIPLLHVAGELNEAAKHDEKAVYFFEEECRISQQIKQPAQLSCHVRLSNLYFKLGKIEEAKQEANLAEDYSRPRHFEQITIPIPGEILHPSSNPRK